MSAKKRTSVSRKTDHPPCFSDNPDLLDLTLYKRYACGEATPEERRQVKDRLAQFPFDRLVLQGIELFRDQYGQAALEQDWDEIDSGGKEEFAAFLKQRRKERTKTKPGSA